MIQHPGSPDCATLTGDESIQNRGIARNRYVVEITYRRVKLWNILRDRVPIQNFHLLDLTWWFALAFSNLCHNFLQSPPDVETSKARKRREKRAATENSAKIDHLALAAAEVARNDAGDQTSA